MHIGVTDWTLELISVSPISLGCGSMGTRTSQMTISARLAAIMSQNIFIHISENKTYYFTPISAHMLNFPMQMSATAAMMRADSCNQGNGSEGTLAC